MNKLVVNKWKIKRVRVYMLYNDSNFLRFDVFNYSLSTRNALNTKY